MGAHVYGENDMSVDPLELIVEHSAEYLLERFDQALRVSGLAGRTRTLYFDTVRAVLRRAERLTDNPLDQATISAYYQTSGSQNTLRSAWRRFRDVVKDAPPLEAPLAPPPTEALFAIAHLARAVGRQRARTLCWRDVDPQRGAIEDPKRPGYAVALRGGAVRAEIREALAALHAWGKPTTRDSPLVPAASGEQRLCTRAEFGTLLDWSAVDVEAQKSDGTLALDSLGASLLTEKNSTDPEDRAEARRRDEEREREAVRKARESLPRLLAEAAARKTRETDPEARRAQAEQDQAFIDDVLGTAVFTDSMFEPPKTGYAMTPAERRAEERLALEDPMASRRSNEKRLGKVFSIDECLLYGFPLTPEEGAQQGAEEGDAETPAGEQLQDTST